MQIHQLRVQTKRRKRVGRGGKRGNYSGKGMKGQKARAGRKIRPQIRELVLRIPKHRGEKFFPVRTRPHEVKLSSVDRVYQDEEIVSVVTLAQKHLIDIPKSRKGPVRVKIIGGGLKKKLIFSSALLFSSGVKEKIADSGSVIQGKS